MINNIIMDPQILINLQKKLKMRLISRKKIHQRLNTRMNQRTYTIYHSLRPLMASKQTDVYLNVRENSSNVEEFK